MNSPQSLTPPQLVNGIYEAAWHHPLRYCDGTAMPTATPLENKANNYRLLLAHSEQAADRLTVKNAAQHIHQETATAKIEQGQHSPIAGTSNAVSTHPAIDLQHHNYRPYPQQHRPGHFSTKITDHGVIKARPDTARVLT